MNKKLSKRLSACLDALSSLSRIADIGSDHAYLPCYGIAAGIIDSAIAIDVIDGPLAQAKATIADYGLADKIELRKGSGLEPLSIAEVEGVNIAGMGGKLISQLLQDSLTLAKSMKKLVFQPQGGEATLRMMLDENNFAITNEQLLEEDGIIYTIMTAIPVKESHHLSALDVMFGPVLRKNIKDELFVQKWSQELAAIDEIIRKIPEGNARKEDFGQKKQLIKDVLAGVIS
jgi:tRNA (adenine22-N1)-methyltransferase